MKTDRERRIEELRERVQKKLRSKKKTHPPNPPPRYDDVFYFGLQWLDSLAFDDDIDPSTWPKLVTLIGDLPEFEESDEPDPEYLF